MKKILEKNYGNRFPLLFALALACLLFGLAACGGGGSSSGGDSKSNDPGSDPNAKYKLSVQGFSAFTGGVTQAYGIALSPDGNNLYFAMQGADRLGRFRPDGTGDLAFDGYRIDNTDGVNGLDGASEPAVSPDGKHLYVTGTFDHALATFSLDASGDLDFARVLLDESGGITGLRGAFGVAISADGRHLYVAADDDDSVTFFTRNATTGALAQSAVLRNGSGGVDGLDGAYDPALSPDGKNLYVTARSDHALAVFNRDADTGALTFAKAFKDGSDGVDGLEGARGLVVSPDGKNVYVASRSDHALAVFNRDADTGALTFAKAFENGSDGLTNFLIPQYLAVSADGKNLYVTATGGEVLADFDRDAATGGLTLHELFDRTDTPALLELNNPRGLVLSSDGKTLYVGTSNGIVRFSREVR